MPISTYLRGLREKVGHDLLLMPSVSVVCRDEAGRVLVAKHHSPEGWAVPGGAIDPDETPADAAVREMWEETGLLVEPVQVLGVYGGPAFCIVYPNGDEVSYVDTVFECRVVGGRTHAEEDEIAEIAYCSRSELAKLHLAPWMHLIEEDMFANHNRTCFQPVCWTPPADGVRKGGITDYFRGVRRKLGHDLLLMPAVGAAVLDGQGNVLLQQRADNGRWTPPIGGMDPNETPVDAVVREVWEETGLLVEPVRVLGIYGGPNMRNTHPNGDQTASVVMLFECRPCGGSLSPDGIESVDVKFAPLAEAFAVLPPRWQRLTQALEPRPVAFFEQARWQPPAGGAGCLPSSRGANCGDKSRS